MEMHCMELFQYKIIFSVFLKPQLTPWVTYVSLSQSIITPAIRTVCHLQKYKVLQLCKHVSHAGISYDIFFVGSCISTNVSNKTFSRKIGNKFLFF